LSLKLIASSEFIATISMQMWIHLPSRETGEICPRLNIESILHGMLMVTIICNLKV